MPTLTPPRFGIECFGLIEERLGLGRATLPARTQSLRLPVELHRPSRVRSLAVNLGTGIEEPCSLLELEVLRLPRGRCR